MTATRPVGILGSGMAAYGVAREFRKLGKSTPLTMVCGDGAAYRIGATLAGTPTAGARSRALSAKKA